MTNQWQPWLLCHQGPGWQNAIHCRGKSPLLIMSGSLLRTGVGAHHLHGHQKDFQGPENITSSFPKKWERLLEGLLRAMKVCSLSNPQKASRKGGSGCTGGSWGCSPVRGCLHPRPNCVNWDHLKSPRYEGILTYTALPQCLMPCSGTPKILIKYLNR